MAKHRYLPGGVLFDDDINDTDEYDSKGFRSRIPRPIPKENSNKGNAKQNQYEKRKQELETNMLKSTERSINILLETEDTGIKTARELTDQGEKLHKTDATLDVIDSHLNKSQKELNGIKSVFHGFKNIISRKSRSPSPAKCHISTHKKSPKSKSKFYGNDSLPNPVRLYSSHPSQHSDIQSSAEFPSSQVDEKLQANLDTMSHHIANLKILGVEFVKEIDHQNKLIEILDDKVEQVNIKIDKQNKGMNDILRK